MLMFHRYNCLHCFGRGLRYRRWFRRITSRSRPTRCKYVFYISQSTNDDDGCINFVFGMWQVKHNRVVLLECKGPSKTAFVLGIIVVSCLAAAHVIANVIGCSIFNLLQQSMSWSQLVIIFSTPRTQNICHEEKQQVYIYAVIIILCFKIKDFFEYSQTH